MPEDTERYILKRYLQNREISISQTLCFTFQKFSLSPSKEVDEKKAMKRQTDTETVIIHLDKYAHPGN